MPDIYHERALAETDVARLALIKVRRELGNDCPAYEMVNEMIKQTYRVEDALHHA